MATSPNLVRHFGKRSTHAATIIAGLERHCSDTYRATQTYYAILCKQLAALRVAHYCQKPLPLKNITHYLQSLESGMLLQDMGVSFPPISDRFDWYLKVDDKALIGAIHEALLSLNHYAPTIQKQDWPGTLYRNLFPRRQRHALGEYYTPDWLVEHTLGRLNYTENSDSRLLDPACGSGAFLIAAIRRSSDLSMEQISSNVVGLDINPLAVIAARTNYLWALGRLDGAVTIPVFQMDAVLDDLGAFGHFDFVVGNPPWVNWENMLPAYRHTTRPLWEQYGLFPHSGFETILGKGKKDLSMLMTYRIADVCLRAGSQLGFLITQSVLKTAGAGEGFRRFQLPDGTPLAVLHVDDMTTLRPFDGATTRTLLLIIEKGQATRYPVPYCVWYPKRTTRHKTKAIHYHEHVAEPIDPKTPTSPWINTHPAVLQAIRKLAGQADYRARVGVCTWLNGVYWLEIIRQCVDGQVEIRNIVDGMRYPVEQVQCTIEETLVFPLLRASDIRRWNAMPQKSILLPQDSQKRTGYDEDWLGSQLPLTYAYLAHFADRLRQRSGYQRYFRSAPFYSVFNVGNYTFTPHKVVWPRIARQMTAAVIQTGNERPIIPQETVTFVPCDSLDEAHYICALVNSTPFDFVAQSYSQRGGKSFGTPSILKRIRIPLFDAKNAIHGELAVLSQQAHVGEIASDKIDHLAAKLWTLTPIELSEMHDQLIEL